MEAVSPNGGLKRGGGGITRLHFRITGLEVKW